MFSVTPSSRIPPGRTLGIIRNARDRNQVGSVQGQHSTAVSWLQPWECYFNGISVPYQEACVSLHHAGCQVSRQCRSSFWVRVWGVVTETPVLGTEGLPETRIELSLETGCKG